MAVDKKISQLTSLAQVDVSASTDVLPIVDTSATETKKITVSALVGAGATAGISGAVLTNGTINSTTIGATTPSTGSFTTLTTSSTVTLNGGTANGVLYLNGSKVATSGSAVTYDGTTFATTGAANFATSSGNVGIGTTSPANKLDVVGGISATKNQSSLNLISSSGQSGFATITNSGGVTYVGVEGTGGGASFSGASANASIIGSGTTNPLQFVTNTTVRATLDSSGNLGLGVTPSASTIPQFQSGSNIVLTSTNSSYLAANATFNSSWKYISSAYATQYQQTNGAHAWYTAPSGTAGNAITFTQAMTLDASGNLSVNTTSAIASAANRGNITIGGSAGSVLSLGTSASAYGYLFYDTSNSSMELWNYSNSFMRFGTNNTERARITSAGDLIVGGTSAPLSAANRGNVTINGSSTAIMNLTIGGTNKGYIFHDDSAMEVWNADNSEMKFATNNTERARITAAGALLVGTTTASDRVFYAAGGTSSATFATFEHTAASGPVGVQVQYSAAAPNNTGNAFLNCLDNAATRAVIRSNGGLANYQANNVDLSDARTKNSITPAASMWDKVAALEIVTYKYNDQTHDDVNLGVIAQQVEAVEPVWVDPDGFGKTPEGEEPLKTVYTKDITFAAIKALQEAMARIEQLEAKVAALEA